MSHVPPLPKSWNTRHQHGYGGCAALSIPTHAVPQAPDLPPASVAMRSMVCDEAVCTMQREPGTHNQAARPPVPPAPLRSCYKQWLALTKPPR
eukprot:365365-Chlamydomonas_euryale.AAC.6